MQSGLVDIWQQYIRSYKDGENAAAQSSVQQSATSDSSYDQNGHNIRPRPSGKPGAFCCKCGKYVTRHKHIKLKITGTPCPQRNSTLILSEEGFNRNSNRLDSLYQELEEKYNSTAKHTLEWNRQIGKTVGSADEGIIKCVACSRQWKWKDRLNMKKTRCARQLTPNAESVSSSSQAVIIPDSNRSAPIFRIRTKTPSSSIVKVTSKLPHQQTSNALPSDSLESSVQGHEDPSTSWRRGIG